MTVEIPVFHGGVATAIALVDQTDAALVSSFRWVLSVGYARRSPCGNKDLPLSMHRMIMNPPREMVIDHINHNPLDNRRCNLRICTHQQNLWNSRRSEFCTRGVTLNRQNGLWRAAMTIDGEYTILGEFSERNAALARRQEEERRRYGEFAPC